jgi:hypothetical protein
MFIFIIHEINKYKSSYLQIFIYFTILELRQSRIKPNCNYNNIYILADRSMLIGVLTFITKRKRPRVRPRKRWNDSVQ